jgi:outer membrane scaffolding protein for murein synthesis (MipA/OmpV family)
MTRILRGVLPRLLCALAAISAAAPGARAESLPLWEAGGGATVLHFPDYRGSEQHRNYLLPVPWFVYRGEVVRADREGLRAQIFDTDRVELDLSVNGSVPVNSSRNRARAGMPDLKPTLELGPLLNVTLWANGPTVRNSPARLTLRLPVRAVLTYRDGEPRDAGWVATPLLNFDLRFPAGAPESNRWNFGVLAGVLYGSRRHHAYFYDVAAPFATATRPAYAASGGYGGWQAIAGVSRRMQRWWFGGFVKYDDLRDASFADSPLVTARTHISGGVAVAYIFAQSERRVERDE